MTITQFVFSALALIFCFGNVPVDNLWRTWRARKAGRRGPRFRLTQGMLPGAVVLAAVGLKVLAKLAWLLARQ